MKKLALLVSMLTITGCAATAETAKGAYDGTKSFFTGLFSDEEQAQEGKTEVAKKSSSQNTGNISARADARARELIAKLNNNSGGGADDGIPDHLKPSSSKKNAESSNLSSHTSYGTDQTKAAAAASANKLRVEQVAKATPPKQKLSVSQSRRIKFANGDVYEGEIREGIRDGRGTYVWANGDRYTGEWKDDAREGRGTYIWSNGMKYVGDFIGSKKSGRGILTWEDGDQYVGAFSGDVAHGKGVCIFDKVRKPCEWNQGSFVK